MLAYFSNPKPIFYGVGGEKVTPNLWIFVGFIIWVTFLLLFELTGGGGGLCVTKVTLLEKWFFPQYKKSTHLGGFFYPIF